MHMWEGEEEEKRFLILVGIHSFLQESSPVVYQLLCQMVELDRLLDDVISIVEEAFC